MTAGMLANADSINDLRYRKTWAWPVFVVSPTIVLTAIAFQSEITFGLLAGGFAEAVPPGAAGGWNQAQRLASAEPD